MSCKNSLAAHNSLLKTDIMLKKLLRKIRFRQSYIEQSLTVPEPEQFRWDQEADIVVAGFGGAGASAAIEAREQGLDVLVLDRFKGGGATTISGGIYYAGGGTKTQIEAGFEDSVDNMFNYLKIEVDGAVIDESLRQFCEQSVDNYNWITGHGVPFEASYCPFKTSYPPDHMFFYYSGNESFPPYSDAAKPVPRGHRGHKKGVSGQAIFEPLRKAAYRVGAKIQTQSKVVGLITDTDKNIIGVKAIQLDNVFVNALHQLVSGTSSMMRYMALYMPSLFPTFARLAEFLELRFGTASYIRAKKGVVLATGGFFTNQIMVEEHAPNYVGGSPLGTLSDDGSGIRMAMDLGAQTRYMDSVSSWRFINPPTSFVSGVLVGDTGKRVCNEMLYGAKVGHEIMKDHNGKAWVILDEHHYKQARQDLTLEKGLWFHVMLGYMYLFMGRKKANSIGALAKKLSINPQNLEETLGDYNAMAKSYELDPMGKPKDYVKPIEQGPFYAINASYDYYWVSATSLTMGGLVVNEETGEVLNQDNQEIKGLYAAGRTAVGIPSRGYVSGLSIADCVFSGRRAARHIAQQ